LEQKGECFTARITATVGAQAPELLVDTTFQSKDLEARGDVPDMVEGNKCELTTPVDSDADTTAGRHDDVADILPEFEAFVAEFPHTVNASDPLRLSKDLLKGYRSQMSIQGIGIPVLHVRSFCWPDSHLDCFLFLALTSNSKKVK